MPTAHRGVDGHDDWRHRRRLEGHVITAQVPLILRREIYATAAIVGVAVYLTLQAIGMPLAPAFWVGMIVVVAMRLLAIRWSLHLPVFRKF